MRQSNKATSAALFAWAVALLHQLNSTPYLLFVTQLIVNTGAYCTYNDKAVNVVTRASEHRLPKSGGSTMSTPNKPVQTAQGSLTLAYWVDFLCRCAPGREPLLSYARFYGTLRTPHLPIFSYDVIRRDRLLRDLFRRQARLCVTKETFYRLSLPGSIGEFDYSPCKHFSVDLQSLARTASTCVRTGIFASRSISSPIRRSTYRLRIIHSMF